MTTSLFYIIIYGHVYVCVTDWGLGSSNTRKCVCVCVCACNTLCACNCCHVGMLAIFILLLSLYIIIPHLTKIVLFFSD
jgi:hypothetical protein